MMPRTLIALSLSVMIIAGCSFQPDTPLTAAASRGAFDEVRALLATGANPNEKESHGLTPLACAARKGEIQTINALLQAGADPNLRDSRNGWTPLLHAVHKSENGAARFLIERGADANAGNGEALLMAAGYANAEMVRELLARGADPRTEHNGVTVLSNAVGGAWDIDYSWTGCGPHTETVKALLEKAPDLRLKDNFWGRRALSFARRKGCNDLVALVERSTNTQTRM